MRNQGCVTKPPYMAISGELTAEQHLCHATCRKIRSEGNFMAVSMTSKAR